MANTAFLLSLVGLVCAIAIGLAFGKQGPWLKKTGGNELIFRQPALVAAFGLSLSLCFFLFPVALLLEAHSLELIVPTIWIGITGLTPLLLAAPQELHIDVEQRTLWWQKGWIWRHRRTCRLDDMAGVCTTSTSVMLLFKKRQFIGPGLKLGVRGGQLLRKRWQQR